MSADLDDAELAALRAQFPITRTDTAFFGHCTASPLPQPAITAVTELLEHVSLHGAMDAGDRIARRKRWRRNTASLLGATPEEIAFASNTVDAIHFVTTGISWRPGDVVVSADIEFPANVYPWLNLRDRGVETTFVKARDGVLHADDVIAALTDRTRLVALSLVQFASGQRIDAERIGAACRERGIYFLLDAIQGLGAVSFDVRTCPVDFVCAGGHKFLLGPMGSGLFYCRQEVLEQLHVSTLGHVSMNPQSDPLAYRFEPRNEASKFEGGAPSTLPQYAFDASIGMLAGVGFDRVQARILRNANKIADALAERGFAIHSPRPAQSGIVAFSATGRDAAAITTALRERGVIVSPAIGRVRAAPHVYTSDEEIERLIDGVGSPA